MYAVPVCLALFALFLAWYLSGGLAQDFRLPLLYRGDPLGMLQTIKRLTEGDWYFSTSLQSYPFGADTYDYPGSDMGALFILKLLGLATGRPAVIYNAYYLLGFPVTAVITWIVLRKMELAWAPAAVGALLFTFAPFHILRLRHLYYTWYFVVPIFVWYSLKLCSNAPLFFEQNSSAKSRLTQVAILLIASFFGVYYAFFGSIILFFAGIAGSINRRSKKNFGAACIAVCTLCAGIGVNIAPNLIYQATHGTNLEVAHRSSGESELYGLKLTQLLLPQPDHRLPKLMEAVQEYTVSFPLNNENSLSALGLIGSIGLLVMLSVLLFSPYQKGIDGRIMKMTLFTAALFLFSTIGGFSSLFALFVSPMIRAWNRSSIFIAFMSVATIMVICQRVQEKFRGRKFFIPASLAIYFGLAVFGIWDQTPARRIDQSIKTEFQSDQKFVTAIEHTVPAGSGIYQLPYMPFPEVPPLNQLEDYGLFKGYLHSASLKWSYGGMKGRGGDLFFRALAKQPMARQLEIIRKLGFQGIYIDRRGYVDHGAAIEAEIGQMLGTAPLVSDNAQLTFFSVPGSRPVLQSGLTPENIMRIAGFNVNISCLPPTCLNWRAETAPDLPHLIGSYRDGAFRNDGHGGFLAFGPNKPMNAGKYRLRIFGSIDRDTLASSDVVADNGTNVILAPQKFAMTRTNDGSTLLEAIVIIAKNVPDIQIRVMVEAGALLQLTGYELKPVK
jgi:phosphoglycerol transferase